MAGIDLKNKLFVVMFPIFLLLPIDHIMPPKNVFSPCVAFRVNGSPVKFANSKYVCCFPKAPKESVNSWNCWSVSSQMLVVVVVGAM